MTEEIRLPTEVLNCDYFNRNRGFNCYKGKNCTEVPDCYYRQLKRLEQENKDFEMLAKSLYKRIEELEKENEALAFRERLYKADYEASEQENIELKEKIIELSEEKGHLIVENNTLKESNQALSMLGTDLASANETVRKEFFRADKNKDMWRKKAEGYRSALEEINILAKNYCNACDEFKAKTYKNKNDCLYCNYGFIKSKINEVLND